jgi:hypothetical protein
MGKMVKEERKEKLIIRNAFLGVALRIKTGPAGCSFILSAYRSCNLLIVVQQAKTDL